MIVFEIICAHCVKMVLRKIFCVKKMLSTKVKFLNPQILLIFTGMNEGTVGMLHVKFGWNPWTFIIVISDPKLLFSGKSLSTKKKSYFLIPQILLIFTG